MSNRALAGALQGCNNTYMVQEVRNIRREVLPNGLTVITEEMQHIRSVSIGIWIKTGSRDEDPQWNGISHFIEHMVFKGTKNRSAEEIARQVDSIGGNMDAFTAKECICFNIKVLDEHLPIAFDVLSDLVLNPVFDAEDIGRERGVILEEIKMDEDNPDYLVHEIFTQNFWKDHPLGKPILGTKETVKRFEREPVLDFYRTALRARQYDHLRRRASEARTLRGTGGQAFRAHEAGEERLPQLRPKIVPRIILRNKKSLEQVQICLGVPSHPIAHEKRHASYILNTLLGGGMSSRLFQNIRERQGLAYSIYSDLNPVSRHRMPFGLCRHVARVGGESGAVDGLGVPQAEVGAGSRRRTAPRQGSAERQPDAVAGVIDRAHVEPGAAGNVLRPLL